MTKLTGPAAAPPALLLTGPVTSEEMPGQAG